MQEGVGRCDGPEPRRLLVADTRTGIGLSARSIDLAGHILNIIVEPKSLMDSPLTRTYCDAAWSCQARVLSPASTARH